MDADNIWHEVELKRVVQLILVGVRQQVIGGFIMVTHNLRVAHVGFLVLNYLLVVAC